MRKFYFTISLVLVFLLKSNSQIIILQEDMPKPGFSYLINSKAITLLSIPGYQLSGANKVWNLSSLSEDEQIVDNYISPTSTEIQFTCRLVYNNPMDPDYTASVSVNSKDAIDPTGSIPVQNVFDFYKTNSNSFNLVGRSATIEGLPVCLKQTPTDTIFKFPLTYGMTYNSSTSSEISVPGFGYYGQTLDRNSVVDSWGTLTLNLGSFDVIRVKSTLNIVDTMYSDSNGFGLKIPRVETHYTWLSKDYKVPLLIIKERGPMFGGTIAYWLAGINNNVDYMSNKLSDVEFYPNPASDNIFVKINDNNLENEKVSIYDINGKLVKEVIIDVRQKTINISDLANGKYILFFTNSNQSKLLVVQKQ